MKVAINHVLVVLICCVVVCQSLRPRFDRLHPSNPFDSETISDQYFTQRLDHFNAQNQQTWQQRYLVNTSFWTQGINAPIFVQIGGEGAIDDSYVTTLEMCQYAETYGALMLGLEHRFYGKSAPFPDLSTENLQYLSSHQALADAALFIETMKSPQYFNCPDCPVITFGGSYPGNLAAWFRLKYPTVSLASVASSAPVHATLDFFQYLDVVDKSLDFFSGPECDALISSATQTIQTMVQSSSGRSQLETMFQTCSSFTSDNDVSMFMQDLMGNWMGTVQYNDELGNPITISYLCDMMFNMSTDPLTAYAAVSNFFLQTQGMNCLDISYNDAVAQIQNLTQGTNGVGIRQWTYQTCAEFGYFQTTDGPSQPFGDMVPLNLSLQLCTDGFGMEFPTASLVNQTNVEYGSIDLEYGPTNILFVNGNIDPWHSLSVINDIPPSINAILINGTAHCANMFPWTEGDPIAIKVAQEQISTQIGVWLDSVPSKKLIN